MIDIIKINCETCNKELNSLKEYNECFSKNHIIHSKGTFEVTDLELFREVSPNVKIGTALTNAKAGEEVIVRLK